MFDKNGISKVKYIGNIKGVSGSNWVGAIQVGDKTYVGSGSNIGDRYYDYDKITFDVKWSSKVYVPTPEIVKELQKQKEKYEEQII